MMRRIAGEIANLGIVAIAGILRFGDEYLLRIRLANRAGRLALGWLRRTRPVLDDIAGELDDDVGIGSAVAIAAALAVS